MKFFGEYNTKSFLCGVMLQYQLIDQAHRKIVLCWQFMQVHLNTHFWLNLITLLNNTTDKDNFLYLCY